MHLAIQLLIQLTILIVAIVIASLILRWMTSNPEKLKAIWRRTKRFWVTPLIYLRAFRAYVNWKRVGMGFSLRDCMCQEWEKYDKEHYPDQPYYRL